MESSVTRLHWLVMRKWNHPLRLLFLLPLSFPFHCRSGRSRFNERQIKRVQKIKRKTLWTSFAWMSLMWNAVNCWQGCGGGIERWRWDDVKCNFLLKGEYLIASLRFRFCHHDEHPGSSSLLCNDALFVNDSKLISCVNLLTGKIIGEISLKITQRTPHDLCVAQQEGRKMGKHQGLSVSQACD